MCIGLRSGSKDFWLRAAGCGRHRAWTGQTDARNEARADREQEWVDGDAMATATNGRPSWPRASPGSCPAARTCPRALNGNVAG